MRMQVIIVALITLASSTCTEPIKNSRITTHTAFGYLKNVAIPEANRIREAEKRYRSQQRIVGGAPASPGQYPYQAGLLISITNLTDIGVCGGTILSSNRILTAAHCWFDGVNQAWTVTINLGSTSLFSGGFVIGSSVVVTHPEWNPTIVRNDIAMIYLPTFISFSPYIAPVALPSGDELNEDFVGSIAIASGFGVTNDNKTITVGQNLNYVHLNIIKNEICWNAFPLLIRSTNICTSSASNGSACRGDSGGPLVVERNGRSVLIGVTSFGSILGCQAGLPSVYSRVTSFMTFINHNL